MFGFGNFKTLAAAAALVMTAGVAQAITVTIPTNLTLEAEPLKIYQQTTNSPCVIGENSCQNPGGMGLTILPGGGSGSYANIFSPNYSVALLRSILGVDGFHVGIDLNQTSVDQIFSTFVMLVNGTQTFAYTSTSALPALHQGNGFADYLLKGFSLAGLADTDIIRFGLDMALKNDGREQFFLIAAPVPIPVPAAGFLLLGALGGLAALRRRRAV